MRKINASAKLIANFERGSERVIRGAIRMQNNSIKRYPGEIAATGSAKRAAAMQAAPMLITAAFERFEIFCRGITEPKKETREFILWDFLKLRTERDDGTMSQNKS